MEEWPTINTDYMRKNQEHESIYWLLSSLTASYFGPACVQEQKRLFPSTAAMVKMFDFSETKCQMSYLTWTLELSKIAINTTASCHL